MGPGAAVEITVDVHERRAKRASIGAVTLVS
jgi:hypothetical protein